MAVKIALQNPASGEIKFIKVGFSWTLFLFSAVFGIPLFIRGLHRAGFSMLALNASTIFFPMMMSRSAGLMIQIVILLGQIVLSIYWGGKGNEVTAKHWLAQSWRFTDPQSDAVKYAKMRWQIFDQALVQPQQQDPAASSTAP